MIEAKNNFRKLSGFFKTIKVKTTPIKKYIKYNINLFFLIKLFRETLYLNYYKMLNLSHY